MSRVVYLDVAASTVSAFPSTIDDDGVDASVIGVTVLNTDGNPMPNRTVVLSIVSGTGTLTQPASVTNQSGYAAGSLVSASGGTVVVKATVLGLDITQAASVTVTATYAAANVFSNLSFETDFDGFNDGGAGPVTGVTRSTEQAYDGTTSVKFAWVANGSDTGAAFYKSLSGGKDEIYIRFYFYLVAGWDITTVQKWCRLRSGTGAGAYGGLYLSNSKGIAWGFDLEASAVTAGVISKANIPTDQWNLMEFHYDRNNDAEPNVAIWLNGVPQFKANGPDVNGFGLTWLDGRLYAGARNSTDQMTMVQWVGTLNGGNTGTGTVYLDYTSASTAGRIGP